MVLPVDKVSSPSCRLKQSNASEEETRKAITERIQEELLRLRDTARALLLPARADPNANTRLAHKHADGDKEL